MALWISFERLSIYQFESCGRGLALRILHLQSFFLMFVLELTVAILLNIRFDTRSLKPEDIYSIHTKRSRFVRSHGCLRTANAKMVSGPLSET